MKQGMTVEQETTGGVSLHVNVDAVTLRKWPRERTARFFEGIAKIQQALAMPKDAKDEGGK